jgi:cell division protein FtsX
MRDVLDEEGAQMLPPLIEVGNPGDDAQQVLGGSPEVVAIGPGSSVERMLSQAIARVGWLLALLAAALLAAAALLTAVWVHLELFRHADEITIMRLIGATEAAIRGPFLLAVALPGLVAALLSAWGTVVLARLLSALSTGLSLPPVNVPSSILFLQAAIALSLPIAGALITLARHARLEIET